MRASLALPSLALLAATTAACGEEFPPYNRLESARVLAISAEPSMPAPGETTTLRAFVYVPQVGAGLDVPGVTYTWSWCPFPSPDNTACILKSEELVMAAAQAGVTIVLPPSDLGQEPTAKFAHSISAEVLDGFCNPRNEAGASPLAQAFKPDCEGGFPVQIRMVAKFAGSAGTAGDAGAPADGGASADAGVVVPPDEIESVRTIRLRFKPEHQPNISPYIEGLSAVVGDETFPIGLQPVAVLPRDEETVINAAVPMTTIELYNGIRPLDLMPGVVKERLNISWFVESGGTDDNPTGFNQDKDGDEAKDLASFKFTVRNKWTPAKTKDYPKSVARLIVIIRDNRGGVGWRDGFVNLGPTP